MHVHRPATEVPAQGWKLHVSATPWSAGDVLDRALPVLLAETAPFKLAPSPEHLLQLNEGVGGFDQVGKFITVYPLDEAQSVRLARGLDEATRGLRGPRVPTDRPLGPGSLVHYRYAPYTESSHDHDHGEDMAHQGHDHDHGDGEEATDHDHGGAPAVDPFEAAGLVRGDRPGAVGGRYVPLRMLDRSPRGAVHLGLDVAESRQVILKRAAHDTRATPEGDDSRDHLRHERSILERLAGLAVPRVYDLVEHEGDLVMIMERVEGETLQRLFSGRPLPRGEVVRLGGLLAREIGRIHERGVVWRDLNPANVIVSSGEIRLLDFEMAQVLPDGRFLPGGTPGYSSPQQESGSPGAIGDDVHALGALVYFLATGLDPAFADAPIDPARARDGALVSVIERCLARDPEARPGSMEDVASLLAGSGSAEATGPVPVQ